jgi:hypothetical protein
LLRQEPGKTGSVPKRERSQGNEKSWEVGPRLPKCFRKIGKFIGKNWNEPTLAALL